MVTQALTAGTFATGVKMRSRGKSYILVSVKRSRVFTGAKRVKVKRLQTQDLRCFIRDIRRFLQRNTRIIVRGVARICERGFPARIAHAHNFRTCAQASREFLVSGPHV